MATEIKALTRQWFKEVWSRGNLGVADQIVASNYQNHDPAGAMPASGLAGFKQHVTNYRTALPDLVINVDHLAVADDRVTVRWTARGTHKGELFGISPTEKQVTTTGISILRVVSGKIVEHWVNWDTLGMLRQLGAAPQSQTAAGKEPTN
jgi:steroid delta-isomerase-like uncharacterized protein